MIIDTNTFNQAISEAICRDMGGSMLDSNNIVWKIVNNEWIGKRGVYTVDYRSCWLEDTASEKIRRWWNDNPNVDYSQIFTRN